MRFNTWFLFVANKLIFVMLENLFILAIWPEHYVPILLNLIAAVFAIFAVFGAVKRRDAMVRWLLPLAIGFALEAGSSLLRLGAEVVIAGMRLPPWVVDTSHDGYLLGQCCLVVSMFLLWRGRNRKPHETLHEINAPDAWPPAPKR